MWLPSFYSVLIDLWRFCLRKEARWVYTPVTLALPAPKSRQSAVANNAGALARPEIIFEPDIVYTALHPTTEAVRAFLRRETTIALATKELSVYEWLVYRYVSQGRSLPWLALALTPIGHWHQTLKGQSQVVVGITPKTSAIIEWHTAAGEGCIGYVLAVTPEETITIEQLGVTQPGLLLRRSLEKPAWRELRPVFISVG